MTIAYGDLIGGISGDMFVAALLETGVTLRLLAAELKKIPTLRFRLATKKKLVYGIRATQFHVGCAADEPHRSWQQIAQLIERSKLHPDVKATGLAIFKIVAEAEAKIHGVTTTEVHFHEVGATDSIVDIIAVAIACRELKITEWHFSTIPLGRGLTQSQHGTIPVPAPATLEILREVPTEGVDIIGETVTPTGAAIIKYLGSSYGLAPPMISKKIVYSAGQKEWQQRPNLFRLISGTPLAKSPGKSMVVIETNVDDMNPQFYDYVMDRLFAAGARDVFLSNIQMKKNRPGTLLRVIADGAQRDNLAAIMLAESSSIGVRYYPIDRIILKRTAGTVKTRYGVIRVKIVEEPGGGQRVTPEYDDLKRVAQAKNVSLKRLCDEVTRCTGK